MTRIFNPLLDEDMINKLSMFEVAGYLDDDFIEEDALTPSEIIEINRGLAQWFWTQI